MFSPVRASGTPLAPARARYLRHEPEKTLLYQIVQENLETFLQATEERGGRLPRDVRQTFRLFEPLMAPT